MARYDGKDMQMASYDKDVTAILKDLGLLHLQDRLAEQYVTLDDLTNDILSDADLKEIGIDILVHRRRIVKRAKEYKEEQKTKEKYLEELEKKHQLQLGKGK